MNYSTIEFLIIATLLTIIMVILFVMFLVMNKEANDKIKEALREEKEIEQSIEVDPMKKEKSTVYSQKNDIDAVMSGKVVDPFD